MKTLVFLILILPVVALLVKEISMNKKLREQRERAEAAAEERRRQRERAADAVL